MGVVPIYCCDALLLSIPGGAVSAIVVAIVYQGMPVADAFSKNFAIVMTGTLMSPMYSRYNLPVVIFNADFRYHLCSSWFSLDKIYDDVGYVDIAKRLKNDSRRLAEIS